MTQGPLQALQAEAATGDEPVAVPLGDTKIEVRPVRQWRSSTMRALREGDFDAWASTALTDDGYDAWVETDPTIAEIEDFFAAWDEVSGQSVGKSSRSTRSSKSTRKR